MLPAGGERAADTTEEACPAHGAEATGHLLVYLDHTDVAFRLVVGKRDIRVRQESKHLVLVFLETVQQASGLALSSPPFLTFPGRGRRALCVPQCHDLIIALISSMRSGVISPFSRESLAPYSRLIMSFAHVVPSLSAHAFSSLTRWALQTA